MKPETQEIIAEVERRSGYPVHVVPVRDLDVVATASLSPRATDSYVVRYRPGTAFVDYAVAVQCSQILRLLDLPEAERVQFAPSSEGLLWGRDLVKKHLTATKGAAVLPEEAIGAFAMQLVGALLTQLRSIPIVMRIHASLAERFPGLAAGQADAIALEQREALGSLKPEIRQAVPEEIVAGSLILNTAYSQFCDRLLGVTAHRVPYEAAVALRAPGLGGLHAG